MRLFTYLLFFSVNSYAEIDISKLEPIHASLITSSIDIRKIVVENVMLGQMSKPYTLAKSPTWSKASNIASAFSTTISKLAKIYVDNYAYKLCKTNSIKGSEDWCYNPPSFKKGYFCVSVYDSKNNPYTFDSRELMLQWFLNNPDLYKRYPRVTVHSDDQVCYTNTSGNHILTIRTNKNKLIHRRGLDDGLFSGTFGGVVKNGKFHLIKKRKKTTTNTNTIAPLCDITAGWNGEHRCRDKLISEITNKDERETAYNYFTENVTEAMHKDNSPFPSFIDAVTDSLPVYTRYGISNGISFYRKFRVTKKDIKKFPNLFQYNDVKKIYQVVAPHSKNRVHYGKKRQLELLKSQSLTVGIIKKDSGSNIWDEEDFIESWVTL